MRTTHELEVLKEFLAIKIDQLQLRVQELLGEKEDLEAVKSSDSSLKVSLIQRVNELEQTMTTKNTELLVKS